MTDLLPQDVDRVLAALPLCVTRALQESPGGLVLAGGFFASVLGGAPPGDIDLWMREEGLAREVAGGLGGPVHEGLGAFTVRLPDGWVVQVIYGFPFAAPWDVIAGFDFHVCRASLWFEAHPTLRVASACSESFYRDLYGKRAGYAGGGRPSAYRAIKYALKGYAVSIEDVAQIAFDSCKGKETVEEVLAGMIHPSAPDETPAPDHDCPF